MERKIIGLICVVFVLGAIALRITGLCDPFEFIQLDASNGLDIQGQQNVSVCFVAILMFAALGAFSSPSEEHAPLKRKRQF